MEYKNTNLLDNKSKVLLDSLDSFYSKVKNKKILYNVINGKTKISLRILDWFVSNFSKKNDISYNIKDINFNVYFQYKARLKSFSKKLFDPFRRGVKITFVYENIDTETTVGQMNFFKWCIDHKILDYIDNNLSIIEEDMNKNQKNKESTPLTTQSSSSTEKKPKRQNLSVSHLKTMNKKNQKIIVDFT